MSLSDEDVERVARRVVELWDGARPVDPVPAVERTTLSVEEVGGALGLSRDSIERHVLPYLSILRVGTRRLVAVAELRRWVETSATQPVSRTARGEPPRSASKTAGNRRVPDLSPQRRPSERWRNASERSTFGTVPEHTFDPCEAVERRKEP